jgi:hypothetical protein
MTGPICSCRPGATTLCPSCSARKRPVVVYRRLAVDPGELRVELELLNASGSSTPCGPGVVLRLIPVT